MSSSYRETVLSRQKDRDDRGREEQRTGYRPSDRERRDDGHRSDQRDKRDDRYENNNRRDENRDTGYYKKDDYRDGYSSRGDDRRGGGYRGGGDQRRDDRYDNNRRDERGRNDNHQNVDNRFGDNKRQQQQNSSNSWGSGGRGGREIIERSGDINKHEENKRLRELQVISDGRKNRNNKNEQIDYDNYEYGKKRPSEDDQDDEKKRKREKADFKPSGALIDDLRSKMSSKDGNSHEISASATVSLKWFEPHEARLPSQRFILYPFKEKESLDPYHLHRQKYYLIGRDRTVADIASDHPSCSSQHAVIVYRQVQVSTPEGDTLKVIKPYIIDLESTNGTILNGDKIESSRYYELRSKDVIKFGQSTREYVLLQEDEVGSDQEEDEEDESD